MTTPTDTVEELEARLERAVGMLLKFNPANPVIDPLIASGSEAFLVAGEAIAALRRLREENEGLRLGSKPFGWVVRDMLAAGDGFTRDANEAEAFSRIGYVVHPLFAASIEPAARPNTNAGNPVRSQQGVTDGQDLVRDRSVGESSGVCGPRNVSASGDSSTALRAANIKESQK